MKQFFVSLTVGLVAGVTIGVILWVVALVLLGKDMQKKDAAASLVNEKIEAKAGEFTGNYTSEPVSGELSKGYLSYRHNVGLVIGLFRLGRSRRRLRD